MKSVIALVTVATGCHWAFNLSELPPNATADASPFDAPTDAAPDAPNPIGCMAYTERKYVMSTSPTMLAAFDYDGDGRDDLAFASSTRTDIQIVHNTLNGLSELAANERPLVPTGTSALLGYDLGGDGVDELFVANTPAQQVVAYFPVGGSFATSTVITALAGNGIAVFHRADGELEVACANLSTNKIELATFNGVNFVAQTPLASPKPSRMAIGRFDANLIDDLAAVETTTPNVNVRPGSQNGGFDDPTNLGTGANARDVVTGDFNGDGAVDLGVLTTAGIALFYNDGNGGLLPNPVISGTVGGFAAGYLDGDPVADLAVSRAGGIDIYHGSADTLVMSTPIVAPNPNEVLIANIAGGPANEIIATFADGVRVYGCD